MIWGVCKEQACTVRVRRGYELCRAHHEQKELGFLDKCPGCGVYKSVGYGFCLKCNKESKAAQRRPAADEAPRRRRYDAPKSSSASDLANDHKAKDKRQLFHDQEQRCVYCGNRYPYDQLQVDHMIPIALGGQDSIRNAQLACRSCNMSKGTMTDKEFRAAHAAHLPTGRAQMADSSHQAGAPTDKPTPLVAAEALRDWGERTNDDTHVRMLVR